MTVSHEHSANRLSRGGAGLPALTGDAIPFSTFFTRRKDLYLNGEPIGILTHLRTAPRALQRCFTNLNKDFRSC
jgi:hypothetical protein